MKGQYVAGLGVRPLSPQGTGFGCGVMRVIEGRAEREKYITSCSLQEA